MNKNQNNKSNSAGVIIFIICFSLIFVPFLIPYVIIFGILSIIFYSIFKQKRNVKKNNEFDYDKSYYKKDSASQESYKLEQQYLDNNRYKKDDASKHYFERRTTNFDKHHAHENMYPKKEVKVINKTNSKTLTKEEQIDLCNKELREIRKLYDNYKIGIYEYESRRNELKSQIKELNKKEEAN